MIRKKTAMAFVVLLGIVSLFADITYEGARSITGQYLAILGASGAIVGSVAGFGELIGYGFRLVSGYVSDKTGKYWLVTFFGYIVNLGAVPLLALAGNWQWAACLIVLERFGKAIRSPARDAMLSYATKEMGRGWGFGLHEAFDQIGAILGPLIVTCVLYYNGSYRESFAILLIPAISAIAVLTVARFLYPRPEDLEKKSVHIESQGLTKKYWLYISAVSLIAAGFVDFPLIAYHFEKLQVIPQIWIPLFYSVAMGVAAIGALVFGRLYDLKGISMLVWITPVVALFTPLVFLGGFYAALIGMILWGVGMGAQESVIRAVVGDMVSKETRGTAYGILNMCFGVAWFLGSCLMGILYDVSLPLLIAFSMVAQFAAIAFFASIKR